MSVYVRGDSTHRRVQINNPNGLTTPVYSLSFVLKRVENSFFFFVFFLCFFLQLSGFIYVCV